MHYRSLFISDTHLGSSSAHLEPLLKYLSEHLFEHVYLVGDFIDFWALRRDGKGWEPQHNELLRKLLKMSAKGAKVTWITGNHDEFMEQFCGMEFGGIRIVRETTHQTADGLTVLVIHGHQLDAVMRYAPMLAHLGSWAYDILIEINRRFNGLRRLLGLKYWSLSRYVKSRVKQAVNFVSDFETGMVQIAKSNGVSIVLCGHVHVPDDRVIDGVRYINCGDHCESMSLVVEHEDGRLELVSSLSH